MRHIPFAIVLAALVGCGNESRITQVSAAVSGRATQDEGDNGNTAVFPAVARPYGASMATWADRESQWVYGLPLAHNPLIDQTGADCGVGQSGHVWFIPRIAGPRVFSGSRTCTLRIGKAIFLEIGAYVNEWPCPDTSFHSAALFSLTGDPTFAALDACVTGTPQPAIVDGFFLMFKPLTPGDHTLRVFGTDVRGANKTYLYRLNVQ